VYSEIVSHDITPDAIEDLQTTLKIKGLILSGGPLQVYTEDAPQCDPRIFQLQLPILGLCYGHQLIAHLYGGTVKPSQKKEFGSTTAIIDKSQGVLKGLAREERVWMSHSDTVVTLPKDFEVLAHTENSPIAAFRHKEYPIYGLQWHPEVVHTDHGRQMLRNFLFEVCRCEANWKMTDFVTKQVQEIREIVGKGKALIALSGGIDSSVATVLAAKAVGQRLTAVFVDHGFMREKEPTEVRDIFSRFGINFIAVDAQQRFFQKLQGITDPEQKRKIIGEEFIRVFEEIAAEVEAEYFVQGTIYPDRIESGIKKFSERIKTHHNVGGLPVNIKFKQIVEPLRDLYKDEVKKVANTLGLPPAIVARQPFPGPGLAARVIGEVTRDKIAMVKTADRIVREEIEEQNLETGLWQYFAVLMDTKSTGVKGDSRAYGDTIAIRAVESREAMTATFANLPYQILERISTRVTNELPSVTRVVYDITHKPPATIEWE
jgi:GMP synthase (glutamine-hydrolysing)